MRTDAKNAMDSQDRIMDNLVKEYSRRKQLIKDMETFAYNENLLCITLSIRENGARPDTMWVCQIHDFKRTIVKVLVILAQTLGEQAMIRRMTLWDIQNHLALENIRYENIKSFRKFDKNDLITNLDAEFVSQEAQNILTGD